MDYAMESHQLNYKLHDENETNLTKYVIANSLTYQISKLKPIRTLSIVYHLAIVKQRLQQKERIRFKFWRKT